MDSKVWEVDKDMKKNIWDKKHMTPGTTPYNIAGKTNSSKEPITPFKHLLHKLMHTCHVDCLICKKEIVNYFKKLVLGKI